MSTQYIVQRGDTLSKIAEKFGVNRDELAKLNRLHDQNIIRIHQTLNIPTSVLNVISDEAPAVDLSGLLSLSFLDAANRPIGGMEVSVSIAGDVEKHTTDSNGAVPLIIAKRDDVAKVEVRKVTGEWKKVSEIKITAAAAHASITSPKLKIPAEMRVHEGPAQTAKTDKAMPREMGTVTMSRSENGNPVQAIALECPNPENLRLGPNAKYRDIIITAGRRSGFSPQSIAAIMNAEAATITYWIERVILDKKTGSPQLDKNGKPKTKRTPKNDGEWDPRSASSKSSARGMTQFVDGSWIDMALTEGTLLHERVKKEGWLTIAKVSRKQGKKIIEQETEAFKLADGKLITKSASKPLAKVLSSRPYVTGRATSNDAHLQKLLDLRYDPQYAINTAVDYGLQNLKGLKKAGFKLDGLADGEKAKLIYLTHHLGLEDAKKFIKNTMTPDNAKSLLIAQMGKERAASIAERNGENYLRGHRVWLLAFIDKKIDLKDRMCNCSTATPPRPLLDITIAIR